MIINNKKFEVLTTEDLDKALLSFDKKIVKYMECSKREFNIFLNLLYEEVKQQMEKITIYDTPYKKSIDIDENFHDNSIRNTKIVSNVYGFLCAIDKKELTEKEIKNNPK